MEIEQFNNDKMYVRLRNGLIRELGNDWFMIVNKLKYLGMTEVESGTCICGKRDISKEYAFDCGGKVISVGSVCVCTIASIRGIIGAMVHAYADIVRLNALERAERSMLKYSKKNGRFTKKDIQAICDIIPQNQRYSLERCLTYIFDYNKHHKCGSMLLSQTKIGIKRKNAKMINLGANISMYISKEIEQIKLFSKNFRKTV